MSGEIHVSARLTGIAESANSIIIKDNVNPGDSSPVSGARNCKINYTISGRWIEINR